MFDPRIYAWFWGMCGGLVFGLLGLIPAFSTKGNSEARTRALIELAVGLVAAPIVAEALTGLIQTFMPLLAMKAVALFLGALTVPYGPEAVEKVKRLINKRLEDGA